MQSVADEVMALFAARGQDAYFGEDVSQLEHALQAAQFAREEGAANSLIVAALVHDIGHLVEETPEDIADLGIDAKHEEIGQRWLSARFGKEVYQPVLLHVSAKRYLCATDPTYFGKLSTASVKSLELQGGPMKEAEVINFERHEFYNEALALRHWDDKAKVQGFQTEDLSAYTNIINNTAARSHNSE
jgi:phosphonate degradation associated HDIG domain protein